MATDRGWQHRIVYGANDDYMSCRPRLRRAPFPPLTGPRALTDMALSVVVQNASYLSSDLLDRLPVKLQRQLWLHFTRPGSALSFYAWKLLAPRLWGADNDANDDANTADRIEDDSSWPQYGQLFSAHICEPSSPLRVYLGPLAASPTTQFVVHLRIVAHPRTAHFGADDLMAVATLPNLGVLEILEQYDPDPMARFNPPLIEKDDPEAGPMGKFPLQVSDRLLRGWAETLGAFPVLRVLVLRGSREHRVTLASLEHATRFPKLAYFAVTVMVPQAVRRSEDHPGSSSPSWEDAAAVCKHLDWSGSKLVSEADSSDDDEDDHEYEDDDDHVQDFYDYNYNSGFDNSYDNINNVGDADDEHINNKNDIIERENRSGNGDIERDSLTRLSNGTQRTCFVPRYHSEDAKNRYRLGHIGAYTNTRDKVAGVKGLPWLAAHWALRLHCLLAARGYTEHELASAAYASEDQVAITLAQTTHGQADDAEAAHEVRRPFVSMTLGQDRQVRARKRRSFASSTDLRVHYIFARARAAMSANGNGHSNGHRNIELEDGALSKRQRRPTNGADQRRAPPLRKRKRFDVADLLRS